MEAVRGGTRHEGSGSAYFVNSVYDSGGVLSLELQSNVSILLVINESRYLLVIDIPRSEAPPL
jgi:hypothetical protein